MSFRCSPVVFILEFRLADFNTILEIGPAKSIILINSFPPFMNHIKDLHFKEEILPLFDYVSNELSRERLVQLLTELPASAEQIYGRQQMLKTLLQYPKLFTPFFYARIELSEAYEATMNNKQRDELLRNNRVAFYLPFGSIRQQQQKAKVYLLMSFLKRINSAYFEGLGANEFPEFFKIPLQNIHQLFSDLELEAYNPPGIRKSFRTSQFVKVMEIINEKVRTGAMEDFWNTFFLFEAYLSIAKGIRRHGLQFPKFTGGHFKADSLFHPLIKNAVNNNIEVKSTVHLLTGPNMSGKSTFLRALGLCVYLAHLGLAVPATNCELKFYDFISIAIDLNDDVQNGYSHFMTEIDNLKNVVSAANEGKKCFAIFDELFRGTNSDDALAISLITINGLKKLDNSFFFISTHLHSLKDQIGQDNNVSFQHLDCKLSGGRPVFTYQLQDGWSDVKIGQVLFEQAGLKALFSDKSK